ncbi:unnamed protein product [Amoebophrya sp. A120]|nr:unnamed protein product [Amoebophrya sp. A120]|eukprot:GSA120T00016658001.1
MVARIVLLLRGLLFLAAATAAGADGPVEIEQYLVVSQPELAQLSYVHLNPPLGVRKAAKVLVRENLSRPTGLAIDPEISRLYVADPGQQKILFYGLSQAKEGRLTTDGIAKTAVDKVEAEHLAVAPNGDLFFSGQVIVETPAATPPATAEGAAFLEAQQDDHEQKEQQHAGNVLKEILGSPRPSLTPLPSRRPLRTSDTSEERQTMRTTRLAPPLFSFANSATNKIVNEISSPRTGRRRPQLDDFDPQLGTTFQFLQVGAEEAKGSSDANSGAKNKTMTTELFRGIFKQSRKKIGGGEKFDPALVWDRTSSGNKVWAPGAVGTDDLDLYFANGDLGSAPPDAKAPALGKSNLPDSTLSSFDSGDALHHKDPMMREHREYGTGDRKLTRDVFLSAVPATTAPPPSLSSLTTVAHSLPFFRVSPSEKSLESLVKADAKIGAEPARVEVLLARHMLEHGLAIGRRLAFFSSGDAVIAREKLSAVLDEEDASEQGEKIAKTVLAPVKVSADAISPQGLAYDGEGQIYLVDREKTCYDGKGGIYKIPAGELHQHELEFLAYVEKPSGLAYITMESLNKKGAAFTGSARGFLDTLAAMFR